MPYINKELRNEYDDCIDALITSVKLSTEPEKRSGICNYLITRLLVGAIAPANYNAYNSAIGVLECCKLELYRRAVAPYEDEAIKKNGDLEEYRKS